MTKLQFEPFYQELLDTLAAYNLACSTIYTDQYTIAPRQGAARANEALAILSKTAFELENSPETVEAIRDYEARLPEGSLEKKEVAMRLEGLEDTRSIPSDVYQKAVHERASAETAWHEAKEKADYDLFKPHLQNVVANALKLASYSPRYDGTNSYDLLLDSFEKGMTQKDYDAFFEVIKEELIPLIEKVSKAAPIDTRFLEQERSIEKQKQFADVLLSYLQADPRRVYLSTTEHPFTSFLSHDDVRITTHYYPERFLSAALSTVHEYGHALYELQNDPGFDKTMLVSGIGSAAHESQSRFLENHIGRSDAFWKALYPRLVEIFPEFASVSVEELTAMINASVPGLIRTEADELTYPLHVLIRYEIEKMMADGTLDYDRLPEIWADKYEQYLGVRPQNDREGVLQDMHWSGGDIGYFPTYALGSAYAAQLYEKMAEDLPVEEALLSGDLSMITDWLEANVHRYGASRTMRETVEAVSGKPFDPHIYTDYLKDKYTRLYHLDKPDKEKTDSDTSC